MRFVVHEQVGFRGTKSHSQTPPGATYTVHDSAYNWRTVGVFRSEDTENKLGRDGMRAKAREAAERLAALLNSDDLDDAS